jgi:spore germination protein GerM
MIETVPSVRKRLLPMLTNVLLSVCVFGCLCQYAGAENVIQGDIDGQLISDSPKPSGRIPAHLYFADRNNSFLKSEQRVLQQPQDPVEFARTIVNLLIKGPQKGLVRAIPVGTELRAIYIDAENVCYVDLSQAAKKNHPGGSNSELLTVYSVVNSLILNVSEIKRVKILIDGNEAPTLAGHISLQEPLKAHMLLIR